jgi:hypothetical protein
MNGREELPNDTPAFDVYYDLAHPFACGKPQAARRDPYAAP